MALTTYAELKTAIATRLSRADLTSEIVDFITIAEKRLNRALRTAKLEATDTVTCVAGTQSYSLPADYGQMRQVSISGDPVRTLEFLSPTVAEIKFSSSNTSKPYAYSIIGSSIYFYYTPDSDYTVNLYYYKQPTALSDSNTSNEYSANYPDLLLYSALMEAATHIQDDAAFQRWGALYLETFKVIEEADKADNCAGSNLRIRVV